MNGLKLLRVAVAGVVLTLLTLFFLGFGGGCGLLARIQIVPALFACAVVPLVGWIVVTVLFGRVYCSVACPLGILQDVFSRLARICGRRRFAYEPDHPRIRVAVLALFAALAIVGGVSLGGLLDPYSWFGRIVSHVVSPGADALNNLLVAGLGVEGSIVLFRREVFIRSASGFALALSAGIALLALVAWKGRFLCTTLCPVGAMLGCLSKRSVFRIALDPAKCAGCGRCSAVCKAGCLDGAKRLVDNARCVRCFNCLGVCAKGALSFGRAVPGRLEQGTAGAPSGLDGARRTFVAQVAGGVAATAAALACGLRGTAVGRGKKAVLPPGASPQTLRSRCTGCGLCVAKCPRQVIRPSGFGEQGPLTYLLPKMDFGRGFCDPACTACGEACPTGAIRPLTVAAKKAVRIGVAVCETAKCLESVEGIPCGLCERRCPHKAISVKEKKPQIDTSLCRGCGACENYCPAHAIRVVPAV